MSDSNWRIGAAFAGIALLFVTLGTGAFFGALNAPHYGYQQSRTAYRAAEAKHGNPSQIDRDRSGLPYFAERIASGPDPEDTPEREKRDLAAQESMSVWAFWMLIVSAAGVITTMVGTGFLLWQIVLTRRAVEDTGKATDAMERQNKIAEAAQRAWIVAEPKIIEAAYGRAGLNLKWECDFRNIGQTVAENVQVQATVEIYDPPNLDAGELLARLRAQSSKQTSVIPGEAVLGGAGVNYRAVDAIGKIEPIESVTVLLVAIAKYQIASGDEWHSTERAYAITVNNSWFAVIRNEFERFTTDNVMFRTLGQFTVST